MKVSLTASCILCLIATASRAADDEFNVAAARAGARPLADSVYRHRWGLDCWQKRNLNDGRIEKHSRKKTSQVCWASDDLKVVHRAGVVFVKRAKLRRAVFHWWNRGRWSGTAEASVDVLRDGAWTKARDSALLSDAAKTEVTLDGALADGVRVNVQPWTQGIKPRRVHIVEIEAIGRFVEPAVRVNQAEVESGFADECWRDRVTANERALAAAMAVIMRRPKTEGFRGQTSRNDVMVARQNAKRYAWARKLSDKIVRGADWWASKSDDEIWSLIPEGNPRALCPSFEHGCPIHGGARHTFKTSLKHPYRWQCKYGGEWWHDGVRINNPKTGKEVVVRDDGSGWLAPEGFRKPGYRYYFVAAYRHHLITKFVSSPYEGNLSDDGAPNSAVSFLSKTYALTGNPAYARKCAIALARIGQLYGTWNGCVESPSEYRDGGIGQFERYYSQKMIEACDLIFDEVVRDEALASFLSRKLGRRLGPRDVAAFLQQRLLGNLYLYLLKMRPFSDGDYLIHENQALAMLARVLDNPVMLAQALEDSYGLQSMLVNSWFRDGKFVYDSCRYNVGNNLGILRGVEWIHGFRDGDIHKTPFDLYRSPDYRLGELFSFLERIDCDGRVPQIGDGDGSRAKRLRLAPEYNTMDERAYLRFPERRDYYARKLCAASNGRIDEHRARRADWWMLCHATGIPRPSDWQMPTPRSTLFHDSGIAILRAGRDPATRVHVPITFSKGSYGHGHPDKLAINIISRGYDWSADLGYPRSWTDIKAKGWTRGTASHCTVMIDGRGQRGGKIGSLHMFKRWADISVAEASCESVYAIPMYRRTLALVEIAPGRAYLLDVFRVVGGRIRDYLFHSISDDLQLTFDAANAQIVRQKRGTLAGEDVALATGPNYAFLADVQRAKTDAGFTTVWRAPTEKRLGLRLTALGGPNREVIRAKAEGYGVRGKSPLEAHVIQRHRVADPKARTCFVNVFEVFQDEPAVRSISRVALTKGGGAVGVRIEAGERVDYCFSALDGAERHVGEVDDVEIVFAGRFGHVATVKGEVVGMKLLGGSVLRFGSRELRGRGEFAGHVVTADVEGRSLLVRCDADTPALPADDTLMGETLIVSNSLFPCNATYEITSVRKEADGLYRLGLNMSLLLGRGKVGAVDRDRNRFASATPLKKLRVTKDLFDGKWIRARDTNDAPAYRVRTATPDAFVFHSEDAARHFSTGSNYFVYDVGRGDRWRILSCAQLTELMK